MHLSTILPLLTLSTLSTANAIPSSTAPSCTCSPSSPSTTTSTHPTPTPSPTGQAIVQNNCKAPIYLWVVGHEPTYDTSIAAGEAFAQTYWHDAVTGGVALKITTLVDGLYSRAPQLILAYTLNDAEGLVYYDLSTVFGSPFEGQEVRLVVGRGQGQDQVVEWKNGLPSQGSGSPTMVLPVGVDLVLSVC